MVMKRGYFISFEGPEGSGKTTQARKLVAKLEKQERPVIYTREPGGTQVGELIRGILQHDQVDEAIFSETEILLFASSRAQLVRKVINPTLEAGSWVVCDRFTDSTLAYQGYARGLDISALKRINDFAVGNNYPSLTILLDIDFESGFKRLHQRGEKPDRIERESRPFHEKVRQGYLEIARAEPQRFCILDASQDVELVHEQVLTILKEKSLL